MYLELKSVMFLALFIVVLICGSIWYYKKFIGIYSEFPKVHLLWYVAKCILMSKIPKDVPVNSCLLIVVFICGSIWYYKKYIGVYSEFPRVNLLWYVLKCILMSKIPKEIPVNSFFFQIIVESCKRFQKEGWCLFWIFQPYLFIYDKENYKILSNENTTVNKPYNFDLFKEFFMDSLLTSGGDLWRKRRKMLNPVFYTPNLKDQIEMINRNATLLVESILKHNNEASSNIIKFLKVSAFRNIYEFLTGLQLPANENNPEVDVGIDSVNKASEMIAYRISKPWMHPRCFLFLSRKGRSFLETSENALKLSQSILEKMKESFLSTKPKKATDADDLCRNSRRPFKQVVIEQHAKDPTYTCTDMQGELTGLIAAGYDTVSYALMWSLFLMGHHPDVQDQVYEEVESVMGHNSELSYDNLQHLTYLECVIKESFRLYPPVPFYTRRTVRDVQCGKYTVPKGTNIAFLPYLAHRDPDMFPNPEKFDPERFFAGNTEKKFLIYPFAEGVRNCIGKNFAMMELKIILAHVIKNFKVTSLDRPEDINLNWEIVLTTVKPVRMYLTPRQQTTVQA